MMVIAKTARQGPVSLAVATAIGCLAALTGTGGGTLTTPVLQAFRVRMETAIATASATGLVTPPSPRSGPSSAAGTGYSGASEAQRLTSPWTIGPIIGGKTFSPGMPLHPIADGPHWYFDFPQAPGSVHYVMRKAFETGRNVIVMQFRIEGSAEFKATEGTAGAAVRLMIQRRGDTYSWDKASYRFWSRPVQLAPGEFLVEDLLTWDRWTNVGGQTDPGGFEALLNDLENVGFTFGGQFAGHGVYVIGAGRFVLTEYTLH